MQTQLHSEHLHATIKHFGAELCSIKNTSGLEFIWQADKTIWPRYAPVLFPIVGKLKENSYHAENKTYLLNQHGFARDRMFELIEKTETSCLFQLLSDAESKKIYPYDFVFLIYFELKENTLTTRYRVINQSKEEMFFSVGAHPGFRCPLLPNESFEDYYLVFEKDSFLLTELSDGLLSKAKKTLLLSDNSLALDGNTFNNDALVFEGSQINSISLRSVKSKHSITLSCENWPYFGIWSKKGCTDFVCLEPWYGIADTADSNQRFADKRGILKLAPQQDFICSFSILFQ